jgi:hypothetical protein
MMFGPPAQNAAAQPEEDNPECPTIDVRQGASTLATYGAADHNATTVRYQATVGQTARECAKRGGTMTMKIGMQGRVILGPMGAPGRLDVPIRFAIVQEGPEPKTIWTKLYRVGVDIPPGQTNVEFTHIDDAVSFPNPRRADLEAYVIYVGYDQAGLKEHGKPRGRRGRSGARTSAR